MNLTLSKRFRRYHEERKTFETDKKILVALSGGRDSVCLLKLLLEQKDYFSLSIGACHVDHKIRENSEADLLFCKKLCEEENVPFFYQQEDVPSFCKERKVGIEEGARMVRYGILKEVAKSEGYDLIATAHSATDQSETLLFRLTRGCGIRGAAGIPEKRDIFIRPLLPFTREEITDFLRKNQILFTEDSTNEDIIYSRNRIRHNVMPELSVINPAVVQTLNQFATEAAWQRAMTDSLFALWAEKNDISFSQGSLPLSNLHELAETEAGYPLLHAALSKLCEKENLTVNFACFSRLLPLLKSRREGKIIEIEQNFCFFLEDGSLRLKKNEMEEDHIEYGVELKEGKNRIDGENLFISLSPKKLTTPLNVNKKRLIIHLNSDKIEGRLFVRNFLPGDRIRMNGMSRSVKKLFSDEKIPRPLRNKLPIICDEKEIIWIPLFGLCDKVRSEEIVSTVTLALEGKLTEELEKFIL